MSGAAAPTVLHVTTTDISLELLLGPQLEAFAAAGWNVIGASAPGEHVAALEARGIRHVPVEHLTRSMDPRADLLAVRELYRLFKGLQPDVVHTHNPKPGWLGRPAARAARVPAVVNTVHGLYAQPTDGLAMRSVVRVLERAAATCSHAELIQNPEDTATLAQWGVPEDRLFNLGNGIDLDRFDRRAAMVDERCELREGWGVDDETPVVVTVGRLVAEKGFRELFEAHRRLRQSGSNHELVVVGPTEAGKADESHRGRGGGGNRRWSASGGFQRPTRAVLRRRRPVCIGVSPRGVPPGGDGGVGDGSARHRHRHPWVSPGGGRWRHRHAGSGQGRRRAGGCTPNVAGRPRAEALHGCCCVAAGSRVLQSAGSDRPDP